MKKTYVIVGDDGDLAWDSAYDNLDDATKAAKESLDINEEVYICEAVPIKKFELKPMEVKI